MYLGNVSKMVFFIFRLCGRSLSVLLGLNKQQLQDAAKELKEMTPDHMGSTLVDKESMEEAIRKKENRLRMVTRDVPPTSDPAAGPSSLPSKPLYMTPKILLDLA